MAEKAKRIQDKMQKVQNVGLIEEHCNHCMWFIQTYQYYVKKN